MGMVDGKVVVVTGAGRGIGREIALLLGAEGAKVVVNDIGATLDGQGSDASPAQEVVGLIEQRGGVAGARPPRHAPWATPRASNKGAVARVGPAPPLVHG